MLHGWREEFEARCSSVASRGNRWALVTAYNPASVRLPRAENDGRQNQMEELLRERGFQMLHGEGVGEDASWEPERSVLGTRHLWRKDAVKVARQFGQLAIVAGLRAGKARLLPCALTPLSTRRRQPRPRERHGADARARKRE